MGLIWVFWVVLGGLLCGWCWVYGGVSWCFAGIVVVVRFLFFIFIFFWVVALWVKLAGSSGEERRRFSGQNREMGEKREKFNENPPLTIVLNRWRFI